MYVQVSPGSIRLSSLVSPETYASGEQVSSVTTSSRVAGAIGTKTVASTLSLETSKV